ncbi:hypothetical protein HF086_016287 [Spodoptera exigua]|uniref:Uncharacterized protein n=1 Tax=Spodoptera exigua TaxID=7107 RepID=A0A922SGN6_SPOEX|nr:hypothetical protein HF086_016287 [Spodoptera exigua]
MKQSSPPLAVLSRKESPKPVDADMDAIDRMMNLRSDSDVGDNNIRQESIQVNNNRFNENNTPIPSPECATNHLDYDCSNDFCPRGVNFLVTWHQKGSQLRAEAVTQYSDSSDEEDNIPLSELSKARRTEIDDLPTTASSSAVDVPVTSCNTRQPTVQKTQKYTWQNRHTPKQYESWRDDQTPRNLQPPIEQFVYAALEKLDTTSGLIEMDQRGRHDNHRKVITEDVIKSVCDHIKSIQPVKSHYTRK